MQDLPTSYVALTSQIETALSAGHLDEAADLVEAAAASFVAGRQLHELPVLRLRAWLNRLAIVAPDRPWLLYYQAWIAAALREHGLAQVRLDQAAQAFESTPGDAATIARPLIELGRATIAQREGNTAEARRAFAAATGLLGEEASLPSAISLADADRWRHCDTSGAAGYWLDVAGSHDHQDEPLRLARALHNLAVYALDLGEPLPARRLAGEAVRLKRGAAALGSLAVSLNTRGMAERVIGHTAAAVDDLEEARALGLQVGHALIASYALCNLAETRVDTGRFEHAEEDFRRQAAEKQALAEDYALAYGWRAWARGRRLAGDVDGALLLARRASALRAPCLHPREQAQLDTELGACELAAGHGDEGRRRLTAAVESARRAGAVDVLAEALLHLSRLDGDKARCDEAAGLIESSALGYLAADLTLVRAQTSTAAPAAPTAPRLTARVIGDFRLTGPDGPLLTDGWRNRRAGELIRLLVLNHDRQLHVDLICEWLWPDSNRGARASLNTAVSLVRSGLAAIGGSRELLVRTDDHLSLRGVADTDLDNVMDLLSAAGHALRSGRGELAVYRLRLAVDRCTDARLLPHDRYAGWAVDERERLVNAIATARRDLVDLLLTHGNAVAAIPYARTAVKDDPLSEASHRLLIRAHLANRDPGAARAALEQLRGTLSSSLGVAPSLETLALIG